MSVLVAALVLVGVTAGSVASMLLVRRHAPAGSFFSDGDRASGVFGVLATGFSVILGFIIFLSFQAYDDTRSGAETEATVVAQMVQTAQLMPGASADELTGDLVCYGRSVVGSEWDAVATGRLDDSVNPWSARMFTTVAALDPRTAAEQSAYDRWMDQTSQRQLARQQRVHTANGIIPTPLWLGLFLICAVLFGYLLFFADSAERALTQSVLMGSVTLVVTVLMLLLFFFDNPHREGVGQLRPTEMQRALRLVDNQLAAVGRSVTPPCDPRGIAR